MRNKSLILLFLSTCQCLVSVKFITLGLICLFSVNCAFTDETVRVNYRNPVSIRKSNINSINIVIDANYKSSTLSETGNGKDGIKKNGYGMETANIFLEPNGSDLLQKAFALEFDNLGFTVVEKKNDRAIEIQIEVNQIFIEPELLYFSADVISVIDADLVIKIKNQSFRRRFKTLEKVNTYAWTNEDYVLSMEKNIGKFSSKVIPEIISLINEKK